MVQSWLLTGALCAIRIDDALRGTPPTVTRSMRGFQTRSAIARVRALVDTGTRLGSQRSADARTDHEQEENHRGRRHRGASQQSDTHDEDLFIDETKASK